MNRQDKMPKHLRFSILDLRLKCESNRKSQIAIRKFLLSVCICILTSCNRPPIARTAKSPTIASLVPAATDLLVGMNAADHLVAVSNWETNRPEIRDLPRVGDYQTTDWEKLTALRPDVMIIFMSGDRMPAGLKDRADQLHIQLVNVTTERLQDVFQNIDMLGDMTHEREKATILVQKIRNQLDAVAKRVAGKEKVRTLVARDEQGFALIAGNTFVDDLLTIAGGENVAHDFKLRYPTVDRERVIQMSPQAIVQLMPDAPPHVLEDLKNSWLRLPELSAVKNGRVYVLSDWYVLQPGSHVGDLAEKLADVLHPISPTTNENKN
jgi:iron complex transport system substrate-binding protein